MAQLRDLFSFSAVRMEGESDNKRVKKELQMVDEERKRRAGVATDAAVWERVTVVQHTYYGDGGTPTENKVTYEMPAGVLPSDTDFVSFACVVDGTGTSSYVDEEVYACIDTHPARQVLLATINLCDNHTTNTLNREVAIDAVARAGALSAVEKADDEKKDDKEWRRMCYSDRHKICIEKQKEALKTMTSEELVTCVKEKNVDNSFFVPCFLPRSCRPLTLEKGLRHFFVFVTICYVQ